MHKKTVVACVMISPSNGGVEKHTATFGTMAWLDLPTEAHWLLPLAP